jgi:hypothetical protein
MWKSGRHLIEEEEEKAVIQVNSVLRRVEIS